MSFFKHLWHSVKKAAKQVVGEIDGGSEAQMIDQTRNRIEDDAKKAEGDIPESDLPGKTSKT